MTALRLLACQISIPPILTAAQRDAHLVNIAAKIDAQLCIAPTDLVVLPELASIDYARETFENLDQLAEPLDGPSYQTWASIAQKHNCHVLYNFARSSGSRHFITAAVVAPDGELVGHYDKLHLCHYGAGMEKDYFTKGDHLFTFTISDFTLAQIICYDIRIPELARTLTLDHNVDAILHCGAYYRDESFPTWHPFATTRALENQIFLLSLNRAGTQYGNSLFCRPWMDETTHPTHFPSHAEHFEALTITKSYQWIDQLTFFLGFQSLRISESPHSSIEKERVMGAAVKIERKDMSARELRRLAGGVKDGRVSRRLLAIALVLEGASRKVAAESCGMDRQILCDWVHRYNAEGVDGLSDRLGGGVKPLLTADQMEQLAAWVEAGPDLERDGVVRWRRADLARRIEAEFGIKLHERTVGTYLAKLGFRRMSVRPHHPKADPQAQTAFKKNFERLVAEGLPERAKGKPLEIWFQDEARVGQQGTLTRIWAKRGTRPRAPRDTRYKWSYIFGAACPERGAAAGLILPYVNTEAMELHLAEIAKTVAGNAHALLIVDGAGWHGAKNLKLPDNITLLKLPPYSPELNPMENVWQYLRANKLAITVFDTYEDILDKCSDAWNFFAGDQERITSITYREWATVK